jgi:GAF domain-containing protein
MKRPNLFQSVFALTDSGPDDGLKTWRGKILAVLLWIETFAGLVAYITLLLGQISKRNWGGVAILSLVYFWLAFTTLLPRLPYLLRGISSVFILFLVGLAYTLFVGANGTGQALLLGFCIISGILLGLPGGIVAVLISALSLFATGYLAMAGSIPALNPLNYPANSQALVISSLAFLLVGIFAIVPATFLISGLETSLQKEKQVNADMKRQQTKMQFLAERDSQNLKQRLDQYNLAADVARVISSAYNLDELLRRITSLIVERFGYLHVQIYLLQETGNKAYLCEYTRLPDFEGDLTKERFEIDSSTWIGWVTLNNQPRIDSVRPDESPDSLGDGLFPNPQSRAGIPIAVGKRVIGAIALYDLEPDSYNPDEVAVLHALAEQVAPAVQNFRLLEATRVNFHEVNLLNQASHQVILAKSEDEIFRIAAKALNQSSYPSAILRCEEHGLRVYSMSGGPSREFLKSPDWLAVEPKSIARIFSDTPLYLAANLEETPPVLHELTAFARHSGCKSAAFLGLKRADQLMAVLMIGSPQEEALTVASLQPYAGFIEFISASLDKIHTIGGLENRLSVLETLDTVSQAISVENNLDLLYRVIHEQITRVVGDVNFLIATYSPDTDLIQIPYIYEGKESEVISIEPYPLGEGLTSIIIRTRQPLMLVEDTERRATELGAKVIGATAKSWLGVPLLLGSEAIGAIVVQDTEQEHRFAEEDQRLLTTMATQVAIAVRNARLLEETRRRAEREQQVADIANKVRASTDVDTLLRTAIQELGRNLRAAEAVIQLETGD